MELIDPNPPLSGADVLAVERRLGFSLPAALREEYQRANGGTPRLCVYEDRDLDTVVAAFLPLTGPPEANPAVDVYAELVLRRKCVPATFFPFAVDGGGDYFFVDCLSPGGSVHFHDSDAVESGDGILALGVSFDRFWQSLAEDS